MVVAITMFKYSALRVLQASLKGDYSQRPIDVLLNSGITVHDKPLFPRLIGSLLIVHALCTSTIGRAWRGLRSYSCMIFVLCGGFWKNKWQQCMHTIHEQATELIACNVATCTLVYLNMHVYRCWKASFVLDPKCVRRWRPTHLCVETNTFSA